jgi:hypothetical protein
MGLINGINIDGNLIGSALSGIGSLAKDIRQAITGEVSADQKAAIEAKLLEIENQGLMAQIEVNKIEAANASTFVSGWRPGAGWVCVVGLSYTFILQPLLAWAALLLKEPVPPVIDMGLLMQLLFGMLGLAGIRAWEKGKDIASK